MATASYGEAGARLTGKISNNTSITKGVQTVLVSDVHHIRPRACSHREKYHVSRKASWVKCMGQG